MPERDREKVGVRELPVADEFLRLEEARADQRRVVGPEGMAGQLDDPSELSEGLNRHQSIGRDSRIGNRAYEPGLSRGTGRPAPLSSAREPPVRRFVVDVGWPRKSHENVDVEEANHALELSSRALRTISDVTGGDPGGSRITGKPLRVRFEAPRADERPRRTRRETTRPRLTFSVSARALAA